MVIELIILVGSICCAYWAYHDAKWRDDNPLMWVVIVLFVPFVGVVLYVVLRSPKNKAKMAKRAPCIYCNCMIPLSSVSCPICGGIFQTAKRNSCTSEIGPVVFDF